MKSTAIPTRSSPVASQASGGVETFASFLAENGGEVAARLGTSTLFAADFRARTFHPPDDASGSRAIEAVSGQNSRESFAYFDRESSSWKMSTRSLFGDSIEFSGIWPRSGTMRNGIACRQSPLVPHIFDGESSLLPTPTDASKGGGSSRSGDRKGETPSLQGMARKGLLPTPNATDGSKAPKFYAGGNPSLPCMVEMMEGERDQSGRKLYPTPRADGRDNCGGSNSRRSAKANGTYIGRALNPQFVEWMMGFPLGWTDLRVSEIPSSPRSLNGSDGG